MMKINFSQFGQTLIDEDDKLGLIPSINNLNELNIWEHENIIDGRRWALNKRVLNYYEIFQERKSQTKYASAKCWGN